MSLFSLVVGVLVLLVKVDEESLIKVSFLGPGARLLRHRWYRYLIATALLVLCMLSLSLGMGWV